MYNGIGLQTPRGTGTNGYVQRNLSSIRKTKEKIVEYQEKGDTAVRPFDKDLIEHDRRRQAEVRCLELREFLEEDGLAEDVIEEKVSEFRKKLLDEKKSGIPKDVNGRPILRDSHELSMAQQEKNDKAKSAFGIREDFVPGSSMKEKEKIVPAESTPALEEQKSDEKHSSSGAKSDKDKDKKSKKSKKRRASSSSSSSLSLSSSSSEDEERRKKRRKKDKKKKSKKSHHKHHHHKKDEEARRSRSRDKDRHSHSPECDITVQRSPSPSPPPSSSPAQLQPSSASSALPAVEALEPTPKASSPAHDCNEHQIHTPSPHSIHHSPVAVAEIAVAETNAGSESKVVNYSSDSETDHSSGTPHNCIRIIKVDEHTLTNSTSPLEIISIPIQCDHRHNHGHGHDSEEADHSHSRHSSRSQSHSRSRSRSHGHDGSTDASHSHSHHSHSHRCDTSSSSDDDSEARSDHDHGSVYEIRKRLHSKRERDRKSSRRPRRSRSFSRSSSRSYSRSLSNDSHSHRCEHNRHNHRCSPSDESRSPSSSSLSSRSSYSRNSRSRSRSKSKSKSRSRSQSKSVESKASKRSTRSMSIPRRRGSPSFLDRRRITSARKRPIMYKRRQGSEWELSGSSNSSYSD